MANQPVPGVAEVRMRYSQDLQVMENVFHVARDVGAWTAVMLEDLAATFADWENATAAAQRAASTNLFEIVATDLTSLSGPRYVDSIQPEIPGTHSGLALPNNDTVAIHANIGVRGRGISGRVFWVGLTRDQVTLSELLSASATAIVDALNTLIANIQTLSSGYHLSTVHRVIGGIRPPDGTYTHILSWSMSDFSLDSQKDRLPNHKKHRRRRTP